MGLLKALLSDPRREAKLKGDAVAVGAAAVETAVFEAAAMNAKGGTAFGGSSAGFEAGVAPKANGRDGKVGAPAVSDFIVAVDAGETTIINIQ